MATNPEQTFPLSSHDSTLLNSARFVAIRIVHTLGGGIPVIGGLRLRGCPLSDKFLKPCTCANDGARLESPSTSSSSELMSNSPSTSSTPVENQKNEPTKLSTTSKELPPEFLDPLTCEIMSLPIILPSGYTIDQGTLDRHIKSEMSWGRKASDPFTGMLLTETKNPIINHVLKERIDHFTLIKDIPLGKTTGKKRKFESEPTGLTTNTIRRTPKKDFETNCDTRDIFVGNSTLLSASSSSTDSGSTNIPSSSTDAESTHTPAGSTLSSRLSEVLAKTSKLRTVQLPCEQPIASCALCANRNNRATNTAIVFYKLENCQHLICKSCLLTSNNTITCTQCVPHVAISDKSRVTRYHCWYHQCNFFENYIM